ncbi:signal-regulatory protein beta-2-like [Halichoeres trimaculatus]|uniref:signal-regulatory protein beta-2-like n=1 Tax=Halichoeres trimaculatus TaxID=147232 RepID=UPI003D9F6825
MIVLWITLLLFQQAYPLIPIKTVQVGEAVTFMCAYPGILVKTVQWFKQSAGETLKQIVTLKKYSVPQHGQEFSASRFDANINENMSSLTILGTTQEDEGMYHCAVTEWTIKIGSSTYLSIKGSSERTSNLSVIQWPSGSDPVRPGDSMTLQCSVLSDSDNKTCPGGHSVFWFRAGSVKSYPDIIYTDKNRRGECDQRPNSQKSCVYHFSKNVSSSDAGTYYCAVAACGRILFGDGVKVDIDVFKEH